MRESPLILLEHPLESLFLPFDGRVLPETRLSDHASFWDAGVPAIMVTDTALKKLEHEEEKENYHVTERRYGSFQRSLRIPDAVDEEKIEARFDKGALKNGPRPQANRARSR